MILYIYIYTCEAQKFRVREGLESSGRSQTELDGLYLSMAQGHKPRFVQRRVYDMR